MSRPTVLPWPWLDKAELMWSIAETTHTTVAQTASATDGDLVTSYSVALNRRVPGSVVLAGFTMGTNEPVRPGNGAFGLGQGAGPSPSISVFTEWSPNQNTLACSWTRPAHSFAIAVEAT